MPIDLLELLEDTNLPPDLRDEILKANEEVLAYGAVTYTTKARVEYYLDRHASYVALWRQLKERRNIPG
jgi:hypothetical protein